MKYLTFILSTVIIMICFSISSCQIVQFKSNEENAKISPASTPAEPNVDQPVSTTVRITEIVADIVAYPEQYEGQMVDIIGYFHGWNVLQELAQSPPKTRSDWVIADSSGAIYVTGMAPQGLDPSSHTNTNTIIHLVGVVQVTPEKMSYLMVKEVNILSP